MSSEPSQQEVPEMHIWKRPMQEWVGEEEHFIILPCLHFEILSQTYWMVRDQKMRKWGWANCGLNTMRNFRVFYVNSFFFQNTWNIPWKGFRIPITYSLYQSCVYWIELSSEKPPEPNVIFIINLLIHIVFIVVAASIFN